MKRVLKLLSVALIAVAVFPTLVKAYSVHSVGEYVNFYVNEEEKADDTEHGISGAALANPDSADERYLKTLLNGLVIGGTDYIDPDAQGFTNEAKMKGEFEKNFFAQVGEKKYVGDLSQTTDTTKGITLLSKADAMTLFGITSCDTECTIDVSKFKTDGKVFDLQMLDGIFTAAELADASIKYIALADTEGANIWVIELTYTNTDSVDVTGAKIKKVAMSDAYNKSIFMPVLYMDKNMECHEKETSMCYDCSGSYKWLVVGEQDEVCTPLPDKKNESECTNEACYDCNGEYKWFEMGKQDESCEIIKSIDVKSKCAKAPKTGVEDYILEFFIILTVGALVLFVVKKNDLFKTI